MKSQRVPSSLTGSITVGAPQGDPTLPTGGSKDQCHTYATLPVWYTYATLPVWYTYATPQEGCHTHATPGVAAKQVHTSKASLTVMRPQQLHTNRAWTPHTAIVLPH